MLRTDWPALADQWALTEKQRQAVGFLDAYPTSVIRSDVASVFYTFDGERCLAVTPEDEKKVQAFRAAATVRTERAA